MFKLSRLTLTLAVFSAVFLAAPPQSANAVVCNDWYLHYADMESYHDNAVQTVRNHSSLDKIALALSELEGFNTYVGLANGNGLFQSSTGVILAQDGVANQWQSYAVYTLYNEFGDITVLVWTHPAMPGKAYWMYLPDWESFGQYHACKAIETPLYVADQVWANLSGLQP